MNVEETKQLIDSFYYAKKIQSMMPPLPFGLTPRHIRVLECICLAEDAGTRISEISDKMHSTMPSITKLVNQLVQKDLAAKTRDPHDGRSSVILPTPAGSELYDVYVIKYYSILSDMLSYISDDQVKTTMYVIHQIYSTMNENPVTPDILENGSYHETTKSSSL